MSESNIESAFQRCLSSQGPLRSGHLKECVTKEGFSESKFYTALKAMKKSGDLILLTPAQLEQYGIKYESGKFYSSTKGEKLRLHFNKQLEKLTSNDPIVIKSGLDEILLLQEEYRLNPLQLNEIVRILEQDDDIVHNAMQILFYHFEQGIEPLDKVLLLEKLKEVLRRFRKNPKSRIIIKYPLYILGKYGDLAVIGQLKFDSTDFNDEGRVNEYYSDYLAAVITEHHEELKEFQDQLIKENKSNIAKRIEDIRRFALNPNKYREKKAQRAKEDKKNKWARQEGIT